MPKVLVKAIQVKKAKRKKKYRQKLRKLAGIKLIELMTQESL
jgi:hypothetical protein